MDPINLAMMDLHKVEPRIFKLIDGGEVDPWDIDIITLCDRYVSEIKVKDDLRISGNALLTAAVLLRIKSKVFDEKKETPITEKPELEVPDIQIVPVSRKIKRKVTVVELLEALKEAFDLEKQRVENKKSRPEIKFYAFDMSEAIEKVLASLPNKIIIKSLGAITLLALLHLAMKGVIEIEQDEWNGAIRVAKLGGGSPVYGGQAGPQGDSSQYA